jgi:prepilin-type N-terminal cleavage/methylation domain-containing protein
VRFGWRAVALGRGPWRGYSLVEVVAVILIVGVLSVVATVNLGRSGEFDLHVTSQKVRSDLSKAQLLAISSASKTRFLLGDGGYAVEQEICEPDTPCRWELAFNPSTARPFAIGLPGGIAMSGATLQFNSWGVPTSTSGAPLAAAHEFSLFKGGSSLKVSITPTTGFPVVIR